MIRLWNKLLRANDPKRRSRFHTARDEWVGARRAHHFLRAAVSWARLRAGLGVAVRPWLSYAAVEKIAERLPPNAHALEVGAGMSTLWLAPRCARLLSIEADQGWFDRLGGLLKQAGHRHVTLEWRWRAEHMVDFDTIPEGTLDFILIDGGPRAMVLRAAFAKLRPGGCIYVDNTDEAGISESCRTDLENHVRAQGGTLEFFCDFSPCNLHATEGALWISPAR